MELTLKTPLFAFICTVMQFSLLSFFGFFGLHPDILFVLLFVFSFKVTKSTFYLFAFCIGIFVDLLSPERFGFVTLTYIITGFVLFYYLRHFSFGILQKVVGFVVFWLVLKTIVSKIASGHDVLLVKSLVDMFISTIFIPLALFVANAFFKDKEYSRAKGIQLKLGN